MSAIFLAAAVPVFFALDLEANAALVVVGLGGLLLANGCMWVVAGGLVPVRPLRRDAVLVRGARWSVVSAVALLAGLAWTMVEAA